MLLNQIGCDVQFIVGEQQEHISAHKVVLASRSSVFFSLFEQEAEDARIIGERNAQHVGSVASIKNVEPSKDIRSESLTSIKSNISNKSKSMSIGKGDGWIDMNDSSMFEKQPTVKQSDTIKPPTQPIQTPVPEVIPTKIYKIVDTDLKSFKLFLR